MHTNFPIRVLIADDHEIYRDGLRMMLQQEPAVECLGEAADGDAAIELAKRLTPEVILMDIKMPVKDGIEATRYLQEHYPAISVIALSTFNEDTPVMDMLEAGAKGFLIKNADKTEIIAAIQSVYRQIPYYCKSTSGKLARLIGKSRFNSFAKNAGILLTQKEIAVMKLVCEELTNKEIGKILFLSERTVEGRRLKIQEKLDVKSTTGIVKYAIKHGIVSMDGP